MKHSHQMDFIFLPQNDAVYLCFFFTMWLRIILNRQTLQRGLSKTEQRQLKFFLSVETAFDFWYGRFRTGSFLEFIICSKEQEGNFIIILPHILKKRTKKKQKKQKQSKAKKNERVNS